MNAKVELTSKITSGEAVSDRHFGLNFVFEYERIGDRSWELFDDIAEMLDIPFLRYPSGGAAEKIFDIYSPNATRFVTPEGKVLKLMGLDRFLDYAASVGMQTTLVVPTAQLLELVPSDRFRDFDPDHEAAVRDFIRLALERAGPQGIAAFELGNEYEGHMTSVEYGRVASALAKIVQEEIDQYSADLPARTRFDEPDITVQVWAQSAHGNKSPDDLAQRNQTVMDQFDATEMAAVDALAGHFYYLEGRHPGQVNEHRYDNIDVAIGYAADLMRAWERAGHAGLDFVFSEWNVLFKSTSGLGLSQAPVLLEMFTSFLAEGVDHLDFWSAQYKATSLAQADGQLMTAGVLFDLLKQNVLGGEVLDLPQTSDDYALHGFDLGDQVVLFISSLTSAEQNISVALSEEWSGYGVSALTRIGVDEGGTDGKYRDLRGLEAHEDPDATLDITHGDGAVARRADGFELDLGAHEVAMVTLDDMARPVNLKGTDGVDLLTLTPAGGQVKGLGGDDVLRSGSGDDRLEGGDGNDLLVGSRGVDAMLGDRGRDTFEFRSLPTLTTIEDFEPGRDVFDFNALSFQSARFVLDLGQTGFARMSSDTSDDPYEALTVSARQRGEDVHVLFSEAGGVSGRIVVKDVLLGDLSLADFGFGS